MNRIASIVRTILVMSCLVIGVGSVVAQEPTETEKLDTWMEKWNFMVGDWQLVERRYDFDGNLIQTNRGSSRIRTAMNDQRFEETQSLVRDDGTTSVALHVWVYNPRSEEVEIARTDSAHYGFSVLVGKAKADGLELAERDVTPNQEITRRVRYILGTDKKTFRRTLEFSQDKGETYFVRSEWTYSRE